MELWEHDFMSSLILELMVCGFTALLAGSYFGTSLVDVPAQYSLSAASYIEVQQAGTRLGTIRYRALVLTTAFFHLCLLLFLHTWSMRVFQFTLLSLLLVIGAILTTVVLVVPINKRVHTWNRQAPPSNWKEAQTKWHRYHYLRTMFVVMALILQLIALRLPG